MSGISELLIFALVVLTGMCLGGISRRVEATQLYSLKASNPRINLLAYSMDLVSHMARSITPLSTMISHLACVSFTNGRINDKPSVLHLPKPY